MPCLILYPGTATSLTAKLTPAVFKVLWFFLATVWARLVPAVLVYAISTEQPSTLAVLPWFFNYIQANLALEIIRWFREEPIFI